jgi:hypothetical protein
VLLLSAKALQESIVVIAPINENRSLMICEFFVCVAIGCFRAPIC